MKRTKKCAACFIVIWCCILSMNSFMTRAEPAYDCAAGQHKDIVVARIDPTAMTDGYETLSCELCGRKYDATLYATAHIWAEWITDQAATCTQPGSRHRICSRNTPHTETELIPALGHEYELTVKAPACEEAGLKTYECSRCGDTYTELGDAARGHDYVESITKKATCTGDGVKTFTCSHDHTEMYTEPIPASGHTFSEWLPETSARANGPGMEICTCLLCGEREERVIAIPKEEPPLFNTVDAVAGGLDIGLVCFFTVFLFPCIRTINKERRDYKAYKKRMAQEEIEVMNHDFH